MNSPAVDTGAKNLRPARLKRVVAYTLRYHLPDLGVL
jgi:hypothetical protein